MKKLIMLFGIYLLILSCSSNRFVDSWRNKEVLTFRPNKLLVIGMTDNQTARRIFEEELRRAFVVRNINAVESTNILDSEFSKSKKSESEIDDMIKTISKQGFDAVVISTVKGVEKRRNYYDNYNALGYRWSRFGKYYFWYQDIYYTPHYYDVYKIYHVETSIYYINQQDNKSLVWVGALDLVNPQTITETINKYVSKVIKELENEKLITKYI